MPRQAAASAGFATGTNGTRLLLKAPDDLDQLERLEFANLITGAPPSHGAGNRSRCSPPVARRVAV